MYSNNQYYHETKYFNRHYNDNEASMYLEALYYGTKLIQGYIELTGKRHKVKKHLKKSRPTKFDGVILYNKKYWREY